MALKKLVPPKHADRQMQRILAELYDGINSIVDSLHTTGFGQSQNEEGQKGDIRVRKVAPDKYVLEMKHEDGWVQSALGTFKQITGPGHFSELQTVQFSPGNYTNANITVDEKGRVTVASNGGSGSAATVRLGTTAVTTGGTPIVFSSAFTDTTYVILIERCYNASGDAIPVEFSARTAAGFTATTIGENATLVWIALHE